MPEPCLKWERTRDYVCQHPNLDYIEMEGCDIGCHPCDDDPSRLITYAVDDLGSRHLRPDPYRTNRNANGGLSILRSNVPLAVPRFIYYQIAPCWDNFGHEHYEADVCDCFPQPSTVEHEVPGGGYECPGGESVGDFVNGDIPDCNYFTGYDWTAASTWMHCRSVHDRDTTSIPLYSKRLFQVMLIRAVSRAGPDQRPTEACTSNMMVPCAARVPHSGPCMPWWNPEGDPPDYYNPEWQRFNYMGIDALTDPPHIVGHTGALLEDERITAARNAVLTMVFTQTFGGAPPAGIRFDRLDYLHASATGNAYLDWWQRGYDAGGVLADLVPVPDVDLSQSYNVYSREPVTADLAIRKIEAGMSLVPHRVCHRETYMTGGVLNPCEYQTWPHVRFRIQVECVVRVRLSNGNYVPLESEAAGRVVLCDASHTPWEPPRKVQWLGYLGHFSDPPTENIVDPDETNPYPSHLRGQCHWFADTLEGVKVPAWPYRSESMPDDPNQMYGGSLTLSLPNNWPGGEP